MLSFCKRVSFLNLCTLGLTSSPVSPEQFNSVVLIVAVFCNLERIAMKYKCRIYSSTTNCWSALRHPRPWDKHHLKYKSFCKKIILRDLVGKTFFLLSLNIKFLVTPSQTKRTSLYNKHTSKSVSDPSHNNNKYTSQRPNSTWEHQHKHNIQYKII